MQGACDDSENWAPGLTASLWWSHRLRLLTTPDSELEALIRMLVADGANAPQADADVCPIAGLPLAIALGDIAPDERMHIAISVDQSQPSAILTDSALEIGLTRLRKRPQELSTFLPKLADVRTPVVVVPTTSEALDSAAGATLLLSA